MSLADDHPGWPTDRDTRVLHLLFRGDPKSVRRALAMAMEVFRRLPLDAAQSGVVEIVLAEVLNNVVEHAYAGAGRGMVEVEAAQWRTALVFRIRDDGAPMPHGVLPPRCVRDLAVKTEDLPEGGFGWSLIRELTEGLSYRRDGHRNELTFRIPTGKRKTRAACL